MHLIVALPGVGFVEIKHAVAVPVVEAAGPEVIVLNLEPCGPAVECQLTPVGASTTRKDNE